MAPHVFIEGNRENTISIGDVSVGEHHTIYAYHEEDKEALESFLHQKVRAGSRVVIQKEEGEPDEALMCAVGFLSEVAIPIETIEVVYEDVFDRLGYPSAPKE